MGPGPRPEEASLLTQPAASLGAAVRGLGASRGNRSLPATQGLVAAAAPRTQAERSPAQGPGHAHVRPHPPRPSASVLLTCRARGMCLHTCVSACVWQRPTAPLNERRACVRPVRSQESNARSRAASRVRAPFKIPDKYYNIYPGWWGSCRPPPRIVVRGPALIVVRRARRTTTGPTHAGCRRAAVRAARPVAWS